jgi:chaperone required for assembly of F1-ATPase
MYDKNLTSKKTIEEKSMTKVKKTLPRRDFLKVAGLTGATAGAAAIALKGKSAKAAITEDKAKTGYQETEHVKTYYELARF